MEATETVLDMAFRKGPDGKEVLHKKYKAANGNIEWRPVGVMTEEAKVEVELQPHTASITDRFKDTNTIPASLPTVHQSAIEPKQDRIAVVEEARKAKELLGREIAPDETMEFISQSIDVRVKLHGLLLKYLGGEPEDIIRQKRKITIKESALYEILHDLIKTLGGPWIKVREFVVKRSE